MNNGEKLKRSYYNFILDVSDGFILYNSLNPQAGVGSITQTQISMVHTVFNVGTTVLLFPASGLIIKLAKKIGNVKEDEQDRAKVLLDERVLETPGIALQSTLNEAIRMGELVMETMETARDVLFAKEQDAIDKIREDESAVDKLCAGITDYAVKLSTMRISEKEHETVARLLQILSDIERVSDYCENISEYAETMMEKKVSFSDIARSHMEEIMSETIDSYRYAMEAFRENSRENALKVIEKETKIDELEIRLRTKHIARLADNQCNTEAGIVFLDALVGLERISDHARNIAEEVLKGL